MSLSESDFSGDFCRLKWPQTHDENPDLTGPGLTAEQMCRTPRPIPPNTKMCIVKAQRARLA